MTPTFDLFRYELVRNNTAPKHGRPVVPVDGDPVDVAAQLGKAVELYIVRRQLAADLTINGAVIEIENRPEHTGMQISVLKNGTIEVSTEKWNGDATFGIVDGDGAQGAIIDFLKTAIPNSPEV